MEYETYETDENYYDDFAAEDDKTKVRKQKHIQANIYIHMQFEKFKSIIKQMDFLKIFSTGWYIYSSWRSQQAK